MSIENAIFFQKNFIFRSFWVETTREKTEKAPATSQIAGAYD